jgi:hypothetical protein
LEGRQCSDAPDFTTTKILSLTDGKPIIVTLDGNTPCLIANGGQKITYVSFELPRSEEEYILSVDSSPIGEGLFSPKLTLLDADKKTLREVSADAFMAHGAALHAGLRPHVGERYLLVSSDPNTIGQTNSHIASGITTTTVTTGIYTSTVRNGYETTSVVTHAYNGTVRVFAQPMPKAK